jgi:predicted nucleic acid-binding protein
MIVFDASTLILLAKADLLERFRDASGIEAVAPREVEREACQQKRSFDSLVIQRLISEKRITVESLGERKVFERMRKGLGLGVGEAEAIGLAVAMNAQLVATDDKSAINACKLVRVPFTTALGVLTRMYEKGVLDREEALLKLAVLEREGRYKKSIVAAVRSRLEASRWEKQ